MLPDPLHPSVVHFPVVLAVILPAFALAALLVIRRGARPRLAWATPVAVAAALALSAWAAVETGEQQEERVEDVVAEQPLSTHEEMGEIFLPASVVLFVIVAAGLAPGRAGHAARMAGVLGSVVLLVGAVRVGHSGGELVYRYGAAQAYASAAAGDTTVEGRPIRRRLREHSGDEGGTP